VPPTGSSPVHQGPSRRLRARRAAGLLVLTLGLVVSTVAVSTPATARESLRVATKSAPLPAPADGMIRITQANLLSGQDADNFQADARLVISNQPDFVTYNEVPYRKDVFLAPTGYALWRTPGTYTGATPVAWRTDKWTEIDHGTLTVCYKKGKYAWQKVHWGIRYANWVTLQGTDGQVISVISAHLPPVNEFTVGLQEKGLHRIGALANTLSAQGPVLMAGDMNFHYGPRQYPRDLLASYGFTSTYDVLGSSFPTGDHRGATIDYIFVKDTTQLTVHDQYNQELYSDHDAITADLSFTGTPGEEPVSFTAGSVSNEPTGERAERRAVLDMVIKAVDATPAGASIHLTTAKLGDKALVAALTAAHERGAHVQLVTRRKTLSTMERSMQELLGYKVWKKRWAVGCWEMCRAIESRGSLPQSRVLISRSGLTSALRIDIDQPLVYSTATIPTTARVWTTQQAYDGAFVRFFRLVGREV
jgi:endonuclease/exonuclease/phosphatase family metal-dependent hydrolase